MASMYEIEKLVELILNKSNELAAAVGIDPINTEPETVTITEEQQDPDA